MKDTKDFNERFLRWKNGENYWEMRGVSLNTNSDQPATKELVELIKSRLAKFLDGKDNDNNTTRPVTTGGAGYIPSTNILQGVSDAVSTVAQRLRNRMYRTVRPTGYKVEQIKNFQKSHRLEPKILNKRRKIMGYADGKDDGKNVFRNDLTGDFFYLTSPDSEKIDLTPLNTSLGDDPALWTFTDSTGKVYKPKQLPISNQDVVQEAPNKDRLGRVIDNYIGELKYDLNNGIPVGGKYTMPAIAAAAALPLFANTTLGGISGTTWLNRGLTSAFAGHGLHHTVFEGLDDPVDGAMTALEVAPLWTLAKPMLNEAALAVENYRYPLGRPRIPENFLTIKPQVRTRVGDVEIDNPNLLYHLDRGNGAGAFSNQGAYVEDGFLFPGTPKDASAIPYSWWNEGKPYSTSVQGQPMTRLMTATKDTPGMLHVRSQNYPIGQWNGKRGFVLNSEYVNPEGVNVAESTYTFDPDYGWRRVFAPGNPAAVAGFRKFKSAFPQITSEDAMSMTAAYNPFKYTGDLFRDDLFNSYIYGQKIRGYPMLRKELTFDPITGDFVLSDPVRFASDVIKGLPAEVQEDLMHNTIGRNTGMFLREGVPSEGIERYSSKAKRLMKDINVGRYSETDYSRAGKGDSGGFYLDNDFFISVNKDSGFPEGFVEKHEGRHLLDFLLDDPIMMYDEPHGLDYDSDKILIRMRNAKYKQNMLLGDAYDNDFLTIPQSEYAGSLEGYPNMGREAVTTNRDARDVLLTRHHAEKWDRGIQNKLIDKLSDDEIFESVEKSNGYGRRFIERLRAEGKLTSKKALQFREAMKYVGVYTIPTAMSAGMLYDNYNKGKDAYENIRIPKKKIAKRK